MSLQYLKENVKNEVDVLPADKHQRFLQIDTIISGACGQAYPNNPRYQVWYFFAISKERIEWLTWVFYMQINMKVSCKLMLWFLMGMVKHFKVLKMASLKRLYNISKKTLEMKLIFSMQINSKFSHKMIQNFGHQSFVQGDTSFINGHHQGQSNTFLISLQYLKK